MRNIFWLSIFLLSTSTVFGSDVFNKNAKRNTVAGISPTTISKPHLKISLLADVNHIENGQPFTVAIEFDIEKHWHLYWINPGDSGLAIDVEWELPEGFVAGELKWPDPKRIKLDDLYNFGYENKLVLLAEITPPAKITAQNVFIKANISYLICEEVCIPGEGSISLPLPIKDVAVTSSKNAKQIAIVRQELPLDANQLPGWKINAELKNQKLYLTIMGDKDSPLLNDLSFFPVEEGIFKASPAKVSMTQEGDNKIYMIYVSFQNKDSFKKIKTQIKKIEGVITSSSPWIDGQLSKSIDISLSIENNTKALLTLLKFIFYSLIGGLILNIMPCVFPVLSLKILHLIEYKKLTARQVVQNGFSYTAGIIFSFWVLAGLIYVFRLGGESLGWGFHLQSPVFLIIMIFVFTALALNFFGWYEIGLKISSYGGKLGRKWMGGFASGVLITLVATPCTAPFMGTYGIPEMNYQKISLWVLCLEHLPNTIIFLCKLDLNG